MRNALSAAAVLPALLAAQAGQTPAPPDVTIRATTRLVEVTVVATDKHGAPVRDIKREDFSLFDDGKPQRMRFFGLNAPAPSRGGAEPLVAARAGSGGSPNLFSNRSDLARSAGATTIILVDPMNTKWTDQAYVKQAVVAFLRQIQPGDRVGIYAIRWPGYLKILYDLTQDTSELVRRLAAWKPDLAGAASSAGAFQESDLTEGFADVLRQESAAADLSDLRTFAGFAPTHNSRQSYADMIERGHSSLELFAAIARHLSGVSARKNLIWVSAGFPLSHYTDDYDRMLRTMEALNSADVALYAVDARGLVTLEPDAAVRPPLATARGPAGPAARVYNPQWAIRTSRVDNTRLEITQGPMLEMSGLTGGRAFLNTNDIQGAIRSAAEEAAVTYTLGFYPDSPRHDGKCHRIEVKLPSRPGVSVRYRKGYTDAPDPANDPEGRTAAIRDAAWSPLDATAIALSAEIAPGGAADRYELRLRIDPRTLDLREERGAFNGRVDIVLVQENHEGNQFDQTIETMVLALKPESYQKALADGLAYPHALKLNPQADELRVIVRDAFSGNLGSLTIPAKTLAPAR